MVCDLPNGPSRPSDRHCGRHDTPCPDPPLFPGPDPPGAPPSPLRTAASLCTEFAPFAGSERSPLCPRITHRSAGRGDVSSFLRFRSTNEVFRSGVAGQPPPPCAPDPSVSGRGPLFDANAPGESSPPPATGWPILNHELLWRHLWRLLCSSQTSLLRVPGSFRTDRGVGATACGSTVDPARGGGGRQMVGVEASVVELCEG